jgi:hypothetical protein
LITEKEEQFNRLHTINEELLTYKQLKEKNESIYIVSTKTYAMQGMYKVGRTKNLKSRNSGHNTTHISGDKVKVLAEFKVNNSVLVENTIHKKLEGLRPDKFSEFFMCPYDLLYDIVNMINENDNNQNHAVNKIIEVVYKLKQSKFNLLDWTSGLDLEVFNENMRLVTQNNDTDDIKEVAKFDITKATEEQKQAFVRECIAAYHRTIQQPEEAKAQLIQIAWKAFQGYLIQKLSIPKSHFKATFWKKYVQAEEASNKQLAVAWRGN